MSLRKTLVAFTLALALVPLVYSQGHGTLPPNGYQALTKDVLKQIGANRAKQLTEDRKQIRIPPRPIQQT